MRNLDSAKAYAILGLEHDASLDELDARYLQLALIFNGPHAPRDKEEAKRQNELIDEAYSIALARLINGEKKVQEPSREGFTMKEVANAQDRMQVPSMRAEDMWISPEASQPSRPRSDDKLPVIQAGKAPGFSVREIEGDILDAPDRAVIVHAVNCQGVWGYGIAAQLRKALPEAYLHYRTHCQQVGKPYDLVGTALLIPPQPKDYTKDVERGAGSTQSVAVLSRRRWVACLFTSLGYGKQNMATNNPGKDSKMQILGRTRTALEYLRLLLEDFGPSNFDDNTNWRTDDDKPGEIWSCKFNSGAFEVEWDLTRPILEEEFANFERPWTIVEKVDKEKHG